jgi:hypothetical protein
VPVGTSILIGASSIFVDPGYFSFNSGTGVLTVLQAGIYKFTFGVSSSTGGGQIELELVSSTANFTQFTFNANSTTASMTLYVQLGANVPYRIISNIAPVTLATPTVGGTTAYLTASYYGDPN